MHFHAGPELGIHFVDTFQFLRKQLAEHKHIHVLSVSKHPKTKTNNWEETMDAFSGGARVEH